MTRERKKPTQSFLEKVKFELEHEEELTIERAYELGLIRGKKETIDKACKWLRKRTVFYATRDKGFFLSAFVAAFRKEMMNNNQNLTKV